MLSHVRLFVTPWTVTSKAPLSMGFPSKNIGVGYHFLLQGIFPTQGLNLSLMCFSDVQLFVTLGTVAHQASLSMRYSRQEAQPRLPALHAHR